MIGAMWGAAAKATGAPRAAPFGVCLRSEDALVIRRRSGGKHLLLLSLKLLLSLLLILKLWETKVCSVAELFGN